MLDKYVNQLINEAPTFSEVEEAKTQRLNESIPQEGVQVSTPDIEPNQIPDNLRNTFHALRIDANDNSISDIRKRNAALLLQREYFPNIKNLDGRAFSKDRHTALTPTEHLSLMQEVIGNGNIEALYSTQLKEFTALKKNKATLEEKYNYVLKHLPDGATDTAAYRLYERTAGLRDFTKDEYQSLLDSGIYVDNHDRKAMKEYFDNEEEIKAYVKKYEEWKDSLAAMGPQARPNSFQTDMWESDPLYQQYWRMKRIRHQHVEDLQKIRTVQDFEQKMMDDHQFAVIENIRDHVQGETRQVLDDVAYAHDNPAMRANAIERFKNLPVSEQRKIAPAIHMMQYSHDTWLMGDALRGMWKVTNNLVEGIGQVVINQFVSDEEQQEIAERRALLEQAFSGREKEWGWAGDAIIGVFSTLPYMAAASIPYAGVGIVAMGAADEMDKQVALAGGDVTDPEYRKTRAIGAIAYAFTEKVQSVIFKPLKGIDRRLAYVNMFKSLESALTVSGFVAGNTAWETVEEGIQGGIRDFCAQYGITNEADIDAFIRGASNDIKESWGSMLVISGVASAKQRMAYRNAPLMNAKEQASFMLRIQDLNKKIAGDPNATTTLKDFGREYGEIATDWINAGESSTNRRLALVRKGVSADQAEVVDNIFSEIWKSISTDTSKQRDLVGGNKVKTSQEIVEEASALGIVSMENNADGTKTTTFNLGGAQLRLNFNTGDLNADTDFMSGDLTTEQSVADALGMQVEEWRKLKTESPDIARDIVTKYNLSKRAQFTIHTPDGGVIDGNISEQIINGTITRDEGALPQSAWHEYIHGTSKVLNSLYDTDPKAKTLVDALAQKYKAGGTNERFSEEAVANAFRDYLTSKIKVVEKDGVFAKLVEFIRDLFGRAKKISAVIKNPVDAQDELFNFALTGKLPDVLQNRDTDADVEQEEALSDYERDKEEESETRNSIAADLKREKAQAEYDAIVAKYKDTDKWMKDPNGKPTNLTERQWVQVRTPSFKKWFGDWENDPANASKVVDENGEPLVVYHGSDWNPADEKPGDAVFMRDRRGIWFTGDIKRAQRYADARMEDGSGVVSAAFLNIRKPSDREYPAANQDDWRLYYQLGYDGWLSWDGKRLFIAVVSSPSQIKTATDNVGTFDPENPDVRYSIVTDSEKIAELEASPKVTGYRTVVLAPDGTLGSPMASGLRNKGKGKQSTSGFMIGAWEQAEERPELANDKGKIDLVKPSGKTVGGVDYNPYIHSRLDCVNAQFKDAWQRPDLVYIENEISQTDLDSGYHAEKATKPVGVHKWNGGDLILSRYDKPVRIVSWEEVADDWVKRFKERGVEFDIVSPQLLPILEERGVEILPPHKNMGEECNEAHKAWKENKRVVVLEPHGEASTDVKFRTEYSSIESNKYGVGSAKLNGDDFKDLEYGDDFKRIEKKLKPLKGKEIKNTHLGISVRFYSNNDINHLVQYLLDMENAEAHKFAAKNIVPLLRKAEVAIVHGEKKENKPITNKWIRMFSPLIFNKGIYIATITIKESNKNIYSIASLKIDNGMSFNKGLSQKNNKVILLAPSIKKDIPFNVDTLSYFVGNVNQTNPKILFNKKEYEFTPESAYEKIINVANSFIDKVNFSLEVNDQFSPRYSVTAADDAAYMAAVQAGDMRTAQRMVDEAAKTAGYDYHLYHGTNADFTKFDLRKYGGKNGKGEGYGIYLAENREVSEPYGKNVIDSYTKFNRLAEGNKKTLSYAEVKKLIKRSCEIEAQRAVDDGEYDSISDAIKNTWVSNYVYTYEYSNMFQVYAEVANILWENNDDDGEIINEMMTSSGAHYNYDNALDFYNSILTPTTGIDGFHYIWGNKDGSGVQNDIYLAFSSEQIKSAAPVTYDDNGNVIPLSQRFNADNPDIRYSMAGVRAHTANNSLLAKAQKMLFTDGVDAEKVRQETGWFRGLDGEWRYEIDDSKAKFVFPNHIKEIQDAYQAKVDKIKKDFADGKFGKNAFLNRISHAKLYTDWANDTAHYFADQTFQLNKILEHPKLFEAYPQLQNMPVVFHSGLRNELGQVNDGIMYLNTKYLKEEYLNSTEIIDVLLHEIQHVIQYLEGFARGASPKFWFYYIARLKDEYEFSLARLDELYEDIGLPEFKESSLKDVALEKKTLDQHNKDVEEFKTQSERAKEIYDAEERNSYLWRQFSKTLKSKNYAFELYTNTAGEIESRDVSARRALTEAERLTTRPDIDRKEDVQFAEMPDLFSQPDAQRFLVANNEAAIIDAMAEEINPSLPRMSVTSDFMNSYSTKSNVVAMMAQDKVLNIDRPDEQYQSLIDAYGLNETETVESMAEARDNLLRAMRDETGELAKWSHAQMVQHAEAGSFGKIVERLFSGLTAKGVEFGSKAERAWAKALAREVRNATGRNLTDLINDTGFDIVELLLQLPTDIVEPKTPAVPDGEGGISPVEETVADNPTETPTISPEERKRLVDERAASVEARRERILKLLAEWRERERQRKEELARKKAEKESEKNTEELDELPDDGGEVETLDNGKYESECVEEMPDLQHFLDGLKGENIDVRNVEELAALLHIWVDDWVAHTLKSTDSTMPDRMRDPVALEKYRKTMKQVLRNMMNRMIDPEADNAGYAIRQISRSLDLLNAATNANQIQDRVRSILGQIQRASIRLSRKQLIKDLRVLIKHLSIKGKEFDELERDIGRKITGEHEKIARYIYRILTWSDGMIAKEAEKLMGFIDGRADAYREAGENADIARLRQKDVEVHRAMEKLNVLNQWGGLRKKSPAEIIAASRNIQKWLEQERVAHEQRWNAWQKAKDDLAQQLIAAINAKGVKYQPSNPNGMKQFADELIATLRQRLEFITQGSGEAGREVINQILYIINSGSERLAVVKEQYRKQYEQMLADSVDGTNKSVTDLLKELEQEIPEELNEALVAPYESIDKDGNVVTVERGQKTRMTWGQLLQLYASLSQMSYADNIDINGRSGHKQLIEKYLEQYPEMVKLVENMRRLYDTRRVELSNQFQFITGMPIYNPDPLYMPVKMFRGPRDNLETVVRAWNPFGPAFTPRIKNRLDFDLTANIMDLFLQRSNEAAKAIAFGVRGMELRSILARKEVQNAIEQNYGKFALRKIIEQVTDTLSDGYKTAPSGFGQLVQKLSGATTYSALSWNLVTMLKQMTSFPAWSALLKGGYREIFNNIMNYDQEACNELMDSDGFIARYGATGFVQMMRDAINDPTQNWMARFFKAGMTAVQFGDFVPSIIVGTGVYKAQKQALMRKGVDENSARERAATITWSLIEECQQSSRLENLPDWLRRQGFLARQLAKFASSPLLQVSHELHTFRMWYAEAKNGNVEAASEWRRKAFNTVICNHLLMPTMMYYAATLFGCVLLGDEPPEEEERWGDLMLQCIVGPLSRIFIAGALAEGLGVAFVKAAGLKPNVYDNSSVAASQYLNKILNYISKASADIVDADWESLRDDVLDAIGSVATPVRYVVKGGRNIADYDAKAERAKRKREIKKQKQSNNSK